MTKHQALSNWAAFIAVCMLCSHIIVSYDGFAKTSIYFLFLEKDCHIRLMIATKKIALDQKKGHFVGQIDGQPPLQL